MKHVEFYSKNKFKKLVHLVGFIIRIYHDTRSSECQLNVLSIERIYELYMNFRIPEIISLKFINRLVFVAEKKKPT